MKHNKKPTLKQLICKHDYYSIAEAVHGYPHYYDGWGEHLWLCKKCNKRLRTTYSRD